MKKGLIKTSISALLMVSTSAVVAKDSNLRMSWWGGNSRHQTTLEAIKSFESKYPDINVKAEYTGWDGHLSRLTTQVAGGTEPDVMQTNWNWLPIFSKKGDGFYDINKVKDIIDLSQYEQSFLDVVTIDGKLNGVPISLTARIFYFNDKSWQKAGIEFPTNWDQLLEAGNQFNTKLGKQAYPVVLEHQDSFALLQSYMVQKYNKPIIDLKTNKFTYTKEDWIEFFTKYKELVDNHVMPNAKEFASYGKSNMYEMKPWISGDWGGTYMWNTTVKKYDDNLTDGAKLVVGPYPMMENAKNAGLFFKPSMMFAIGRSTKNPEAAAKLINYLINDPEGIKILGLERGVPLSKIAEKTLSENGVIKESDPTVAGLKLALSLPNNIGVSPYFDDPQIVQLFGTAIQYIDYGQKSVEATAIEFQKQAERILKRSSK